MSSSEVIRRPNSLVPLSRLRPNADLNCPPPNWLRSSDHSTFTQHQSTAAMTFRQDWDDQQSDHVPTSVLLASHHPKAVGHVDIVADAKNIKKLLKLPYSNSSVSLAVHQVGNKTLLIDDFNPLLLSSGGASSGLEKVFQESPASSLVQQLVPRKKDPSCTHERNMMSKFLYYSSQKEKTLVHQTSPNSHRGQLSLIKSGCSKDDQFVIDDADYNRRVERRASSEPPMTSFINLDVDHASCVAQSDLFRSADCQAEMGFSSAHKDQYAHEAHHQDKVRSMQLVPSFPPTKALAVLPDLNSPLQPTLATHSSNSLAPPKVHKPSSSLIQSPSAAIVKDVPREGDNEPDSFPSQPSPLLPQPYNLEVQWTVKDVRMLLGSDLPIFGVDGHPAISVRLRDMRKPITVLTGMDYWLDNLMCNVPELAMCFHVDGLVQKYRVIKTEDIPSLSETCQFPPQEVLDVAHNILGFLKANCTREGHTYWLFRKKGDDVVKLYDLTSLDCFQEEGQDSHNPFAKSVATLFYRVAHNMLAREDNLSSEDLAMTKLLLENCIKLMGHKDKEITLSAYYLLADVFLNKVNYSDTQWDKSSTDEDPPKPEARKPEANSNTILPTRTSKSLSVSLLREGRCSSLGDWELPLPPLKVGSSMDRARLALEQISDGLLSIGLASHPTPLDKPSWKLRGTSQLMAQAGSAYLMLAKISLEQNKLGRALRYGKYSVLSSSASSKFLQTAAMPSANHTLSQAWQLCGDIHCLSTKLSESLSAHLEDFESENPEDSQLINLVLQVIANTSCEGTDERDSNCLNLYTDLETSLLRSIDCYQLARSFHKTPLHTLEERLGNAWNELGVYYLQLATKLDFTNEPKQVEKLWKSSYSCISDGLSYFVTTGNVVNQALLSANLGKLMSSCAYAHGLQAQDEGQDKNHTEIQERDWEYSQPEKHYYSKSIQYYLDAKQILQRQSAHPDIWSNVTIDLSRVYLAMGTIMFNNPPISYLTQQQIFSEVSDALNKAVHNAEREFEAMNSHHPRYLELCKVVGDCHTRLGELCHQGSLNSSLSSQKLRQFRMLAEKHLKKAVATYKIDCHFLELLELHLSTAQHFFRHAHGKTRLRGLQSALSSLLQAVDPLKFLSSHSDKAALDDKKIRCISDTLLKQLTEIIKELLVATKKKSEDAAEITVYKQMYGEVLQQSKLQSTEQSNYSQTIVEVLIRIKLLYVRRCS